MLNLVLTALALFTVNPNTVKAVPPTVTQALQPTDAVFHLLVVPAGQTPDPSMEVGEVAENLNAVQIKLDPAFAKNGWSCEVSAARKMDEDKIRRSVTCTKLEGKRKSIAYSYTHCPIVGSGRNYTSLSVGVGTPDKLEVGVTLFLACMTNTPPPSE